MDESRYVPVFFDIETTGLNPLAQGWHRYQDYDAQVFAVGLGYFDDWPDGCEEPVTETVWESDEYRMLQQLRKKMHNLADDLEGNDREIFLVGWNSRAYDHPYLVARYSRLRQDPFPFCHKRKRLDMMRIVRNNTGKFWKEDDYAEFLGVEDDDPYTGADMPDAFNNNEWDKIFTHVESDTEVMLEVFKREKEMFMQGFYDHYGIDREPVFIDDVEL